MSFAVATAIPSTRAIIHTRVRDTWLGMGQPASSIQWPNHYVAPPDEGYWLRVTEVYGLSDQLGWGEGSVSDKRGIIILQLYGPKGVGEGVLMEMMGQLSAAFERVMVSGVWFYSVDGPSPQDEEHIAGRRLTVRFLYYETV